MVTLMIAEIIVGLMALIVTAMAFTHMSWGEGAASGALKKESMRTAKRLFWVAGLLWALCVGCYAYIYVTEVPRALHAHPSGGIGSDVDNGNR
jgi:hypothetical protein